MYQEKKVIGIIVAAGVGSRMGLNLPKQFLKIGSKTMIEETCEKFEKNRYVDGFFVVSGEDYMDYVKDLLSSNKKLIDVVPGGSTRQESAGNAVALLEDDCIALIHDCARPYVDDDTIERIVSSTFRFGAAIPVINLSDTVKTVLSLDNVDSFVRTTLDRESLRLVQTPQGFKSELIKKAYKNAEYLEIIATDDSSLVEIMGETVAVVAGNQKNIKITRKEDMPCENRVGNGFDVHKLVKGRTLIIGGEKIPCEKGLEGHSDADVLTHAVMDALLGAASLGDIGLHFPDSEEKYKGANSIELLKKVGEMLEKEGFELVNIDSTIMCEKPKMLPYIENMRQNIAEALLTEVSRINIKATTTEKLGFIGREEGIAASSICLLKVKHS